MTPNNPFHPGAPSRPDSFVGRTGIIERLYAALFATRDQALVSIFGQRRIGKTSLLWRLEKEWKDRPGVQVLVFDGLQMQADSPEIWLGELARRIASQGEEQSASSIWERLESLLASVDRRILLLVDEFDALAGQGAESFDGSFFASLRALLTSQNVLGKMTLVTATRQDLDASTWSKEMGPGSPFANISGLQEKLGFLSAPEALELLGRGSDFLSQGEIDFLYRLAGPHPHFLQVAGVAAWLAKRGAEEDFEASVRGRFMISAQSVYRSILRALSKEVRDDLYIRAVLGRGLIERERRLREDLLVNAEGEIYSEGLRAYCLGDGESLLSALRQHFRRLPKSLRQLLREHSYSYSSDSPIPEEKGFMLKEFGWLGAGYKVLPLVRLMAPQIMEDEEDA